MIVRVMGMSIRYSLIFSGGESIQCLLRIIATSIVDTVMIVIGFMFAPSGVWAEEMWGQCGIYYSNTHPDPQGDHKREQMFFQILCP